MSALTDQYQAVADPFGHGTSVASLGLQMNMTRGQAFPWTAGGVALLRRQLYPTTGEWMYCGLALSTDSQISNFPGLTHTAEQAYQYAAVRILGNGFISRGCEPVRVDFDAAGDLITPRLPMFPLDIIAEPIAGGKFRVSWDYDRYGEGAPPTDFQVFEGTTPATVDYDTPLTDSVTSLAFTLYIAEQRAFSFTTTAYSHGTPHAFGVRGRNSGGVAELNTYKTNAINARNVTPVDAAAAQRVYLSNSNRHRG